MSLLCVCSDFPESICPCYYLCFVNRMFILSDLDVTSTLEFFNYHLSFLISALFSPEV